MSILNLLYSSILKITAVVIILREVFEHILAGSMYIQNFMLIVKLYIKNHKGVAGKFTSQSK